MANSQHVFPNNLPTQSTSFIGRESELANIVETLSQSRLITLTGAGGSGKTRLALQIAANVLTEFPDGVWVTELAGLSDSTLVVQAVAKAVEVQENPNQTLIETLSTALGHRRLLLILDNCEHILNASASLAKTLLYKCTEIRILATSQQALGIPGELVRPIPGLSLLDTHTAPTAENLVAESDAAQLFVARATTVQPQFRLNYQNAFSVARICQRLDGVPLAIELAAARVKVLALQQIADRLDHVFRLLTRGGETSLPRHQTLRAAVDWSYQLLSVPARLLLRRLSVFAGDFSLTAAEAICAGEDLAEEEILDLLTDLVEHSLVQVSERESLAEARYQLLEMIRQYGQEKLEEAMEAEQVRERHIAFFLHLAEESESKLKGGEQLIWLRRLDAEYDNVREALSRCITYESSAPDVQIHMSELGLRLASSLWLFWIIRGHLTEARDWLERALAKNKGVSAMMRAKGFSAFGTVVYNRGDMPQTLASHQEALKLYQEVEDQRGIAFSLSNLGSHAIRNGGYEKAMEYFTESLALYRQLGDPQGMAMVLSNMGIATRDQGDPSQAADFYKEGLVFARQSEDRLYIAVLLINLGELAYDGGDYTHAIARFEEALPLVQEMEHTSASVFVKRIFGDIARAQGNLVQAAKYFRENLQSSRQLGDMHSLTESLVSLAKVFGMGGDPHTGTLLFSAGEAIRKTIDEQLPPADQAEYDQSLAALRAGLDEANFLQAWAAGQAMTPEQAIALAEAQPVPAKPATNLETKTSIAHPLPRYEMDKKKYGGLTSREREVAAQIAQGKSNQMIAAELYVSFKTVEAHVTRILSKLGFTSRAQIAAWAVGKGLAEAPRDLDTLGKEG